MLKLNQKVTIILPNKPGQKRINEKIKREGVVKYINNKFITIWVKAQKSNRGWNESFLIQDIGNLVLIQDAASNKLKKIC